MLWEVSHFGNDLGLPRHLGTWTSLEDQHLGSECLERNVNNNSMSYREDINETHFQHQKTEFEFLSVFL